ncbi:hypothetical protein CSAL01_07623 [Colletotrichum salicis]|uniref:Uncharacterized protein n=1 Tax=Colletotrichum salicis TaxID=1209931 RepID=A0A135V9P5_9PEZI|nr:hypothetical protein CSAL01_07623 [Colletotrichum salicis]
MGHDATDQEIMEVWNLLMGLSGAILVIVLIREIFKLCRGFLLERHIQRSLEKALFAYQVLEKMQQSLREDVLSVRAEFGKSNKNGSNLFGYGSASAEQEKKTIEKDRKEVEKMKADLDKEKNAVEIMKVDVSKGLEELQKLRAKIVEKTDEDAGSGDKVGATDGKDTGLQH